MRASVVAERFHGADAPAFARTAVLVLYVLLAPFLILAACDDGTGPDEVLEIVVTGRLERGLTVQVTVTRDDQELPPSQVELSSNPVGAVEFLGEGAARLLQAGSVRILARSDDASGEQAIEVAVPPTIFFDMIRDGHRNVFQVALDGRDLTALTTASTPDLDPSVASGTVAFISLRDGNAEVYTVPAQGGSPVRITGTGASERDVALSADGQKLAFVRSTGGNFRLWTASADGSGEAVATDGFGGIAAVERGPSWAPSGDRLVFMSTADGTADLFEWSDGEVTPVVATDEGAEGEPAWAPGGGRIVFLADRQGETAEADLLLLNLETGQETRLTDRAGSEGEPAWLPDGRVVYVAFLSEGTELRWLDPAQPGETMTIPLDGSNPRNPTAERLP